jgi:hypothetical protein
VQIGSMLGRHNLVTFKNRAWRVNGQENPGEASVPVNVPWIVPDDVEKLTVPVTALPEAEDANFIVKVVDVIDMGMP